MLKRRLAIAKVCLNVKLDQINYVNYYGTPRWHWPPSLLHLLSLSRRHLSTAGPPWVCVFPRHLFLSPTPGGPLLGQTLPAAAWGPGADCQKSGHLECWGGQTCSHAHTVPTHEKQAYSSFTHPSWRHLVVQGNWLWMNIQGELFWLLGMVGKHFLKKTFGAGQLNKLIFFVRWQVLSKDSQDVKNMLLHLKQR